MSLFSSNKITWILFIAVVYSSFSNCCAVWCVFTFSVHARTALLSFHTLCLWSKTNLMRAGKERKPQRTWTGAKQRPASSTPSIDTYLLLPLNISLSASLSFLLTHKQHWYHSRNKPLGTEPTLSHTHSDSDSITIVIKQTQKRTCCFTNTHLPWPLSPGCVCWSVTQTYYRCTPV